MVSGDQTAAPVDAVPGDLTEPRFEDFADGT
jgi:hypothetical protein